ncbi:MULTISPECIES: DUF1834 family protein [Escherichia]|uniref:DUF1834 family protein n=1 Tax=Escherichia TaxID=561 RepID=UPI000CFCB7A5|nr:DUF1834 family protein [Escherichia coli]MED0011700.1 DUF1834 family protein [Escherichia coli]MED0498973.1 DUF1834 family protein [Escherichia coli]MED8772206.1 DUF1834 family protein [Escherichia coli]
MITEIERALVERLRCGLGHMVREVRTYAGELDEDPGRIVRSLPAVWVTFGGIVKTERYSTSRQKYIATGRFVVVVGDYTPRSEQSARQGGTVRDEVGTNLLVESVRRLLTGQDLGLEIDYFEPGRVRTLFNTGVAERAMSVFACEFDTRWVEHALENGKWPERGAEADMAFNRYHGRLSDPDPDFLRAGLDCTSGVITVSDLIELRKQKHDQHES